MDGIGAFLAMGGYAGFVWPAYGVALAVLGGPAPVRHVAALASVGWTGPTVLGGLAVLSWRRYRESIVTLERLQQDGKRR